ncbi:universal stress protein [Exiguobacterium sp. TBG-PICH-001]|uniref:universal stress protein n=1 Tax=Exiguobacterium abrahamii TaxID=2785532 RepID=UPI0018A741EA|nr:universal stress protein [Exiguobacterium sp. TBG-PICH-001]MBF8151885.1 universal stress protein [Exiguobacterium sp. TBG-PICH-001]
MTRGKLKLYIGSAPGVGKTYKMLADARTLTLEGKDVVIGLIETHGRKETAEMVGQLEQVPLLEVVYKDKTFPEVNVDAIIARRPDIVLIDELAHTNAPGSVRKKRYQDVAALLEAGINVYSAVNIQHFESLLFKVKEVTGVEVRERIPDPFLGEADEILLVDVTPQTLRERLEQGKIYKKEKIEQSLNSFFSLQNLASLRELSLRQVADEVDDQVYQSRLLIEKDPASLQERILVCIQLNDNARKLIYRGFRMASRLKADLYVLTILPAAENQLNAKQKEVLAMVRESGSLFGAEVLIRIQGERSIAQAITAAAKHHRITQIVLGQSARTRWQEVRRGSIINEIMRHVRGIDIQIVADDMER